MSDQHWIAKLGLQAHPEGGYFKRIYTAAARHRTVASERPLATSIYYLLDRSQPLGFMHRNRSDILHFFLDGGPLEYVLLAENGELQRERLGKEAADSRFLLVPGGCWKASQLIDGARHALVAEVVAPGFDDADHQFLGVDQLLRAYPQHFDALLPFLKPGG
jgi:uncharacterized protein